MTLLKLAPLFATGLLIACSSEETPSGTTSESTSSPTSSVSRLPAPEEMLRLLPENTVVFAIAPSMETFDSVIKRLSESAELDALSTSPIRDTLESDSHFDSSLIDSSMPIGLAVGLRSEGQPGFTPVILLPSTDPAALLASVQPRVAASPAIREGNYIGIPTGPQYTPSFSRPAIAKGMRANVARLRLNMRALMTVLGPNLDASFNSWKQQYGSAGSSPLGSDMGVAADAFFESSSQALRFMNALDLELTLVDDQFAINWEVSLLPGSAAAALHSKAPTSLTPLTQGLDPNATIGFALGLEMSSAMDSILPFAELALLSLPQENRIALRRSIEEMRPLYPLLGTGMTGQIHYVEEALSATVFVQTEEAERLSKATADNLSGQTAELTKGGLALGALQAHDSNGFSVHQFPLSPCPSSLSGIRPKVSIASNFPTDLGPSPSLNMTAHEESMVVLLTTRNEELDSELKRIRDAKDQVATELTSITGGMEGSNPALAVRFDLGRLLTKAPLWKTTLGAQAAERSPLFLSVFGGIRASSMAGGASIDLSSLAEYFNGISHRKQVAQRAPELIASKLQSIQDEATAKKAALELERPLNDLAEFLRDHEGYLPDQSQLSAALKSAQKISASDPRVLSALERPLQRLRALLDRPTQASPQGNF